MPTTTTSTNMAMPVPVVGTDPGPQYATDLNTCLSIIDAHDHTAGNGVAITPSGLNINADLTFQTTSSITNIKKVGFTSQGSALTGTSFLSFVGGNLYVNDSSGNQIPITSAGGVAGSPGSIGSLTSPASATYTAGSKLFTWSADSGKAAAMDNGAVTIRETNIASAKGVTIASAGSLAADYQLTLPAALPGSTQYMTSTSAGVLAFSSADAIGSAMTATGSNAVAATRTRTTGTTVGIGGVALSASSGVFTTSSSTLTDVTNLSVTITTSGRPVILKLVADGSTVQFSQVYAQSVGAESPYGILAFLQGATVISLNGIHAVTNAGNTEIYYPPNAYEYLDFPVAGTYTYKVQIKRVNSNNNIGVLYSKLVAFEL